MGIFFFFWERERKNFFFWGTWGETKRSYAGFSNVSGSKLQVDNHISTAKVGTTSTFNDEDTGLALDEEFGVEDVTLSA